MRRRGTLWMVGGIGILVLAGLLTALLAARQPEAHYAANSPQGTVATYLKLLQAGQVDKAYAMASWDDTGAYTSLSNFHQQFDSWNQTSHRVTVVRTIISGQRASVIVDIAAFSGGAFGPTDQTRRQTITLLRSGRGWLISGPFWLGYP